MRKILVLYASITGNTEMIADIIVGLLDKKQVNYDVKVFDVDDIKVEDLLNYDIILFGTYTWTSGELPFEVEKFYDDLIDVDLTGKVCAVFGSGDKYYDEFCGAVDIMYEAFEERGATMIPYKVKVDMDPEAEDIPACQRLVTEACQSIEVV